MMNHVIRAGFFYKGFMYRSVLLIVGIVASFAVHAQSAKSTLFAVDVSLNAQQRSAAFDLIGEVIQSAPQDRSLGLTLFDDTVRHFVATATLSVAQIKTLNQAVAEAPASVRSTSNLAVGIERAIDDPVSQGGADLVVFARGIIDTPSQDPRARFGEWLEQILLPQAIEKQVSITLVLPIDAVADPGITAAFQQSVSHQVVFWGEDNHAAPELVRILGVTDRAFGASVAQTPLPTEAPLAEVELVTSNNELADSSAALSTSVWPVVRIIVLTIAAALFIVIVYWWNRARRRARVRQQITSQSSTYLPLTSKPASTMDNWKTGSQNPSGRSLTPPDNLPTTIRKQSGKSSNAQPLATEIEKDPWDD